MLLTPAPVRGSRQLPQLVGVGSQRVPPAAGQQIPEPSPAVPRTAARVRMGQVGIARLPALGRAGAGMSYPTASSGT